MFDLYILFNYRNNLFNGAPLKSRAKAPEGEGCPRCGGVVYAAEQMLARGRVSNFLHAWSININK
jgi:hypothetical protein